MSERLLTSRELAEYLGLSSATVLDWFEAADFPDSVSAVAKVGPFAFDSAKSRWCSKAGVLGRTPRRKCHRPPGAQPEK